MVSNVKLPEDDSVDMLRRIISERVGHKVFYDRISTDLIERAKLYIDVFGDPQKIGPIKLRDYTDTDDEALKRKDSLIGLYKPKEGKLPYSQLEKIRKENGLVFCPSCGELGRPRTLDHYLPKDKFPEFSVLLLNLTPMCDWCQGEKLAEYMTADGHKRYIHPYFDDIDRPLFNIVFIPPYNAPVIDIAVNESLPKELRLLVPLHLEGIDFLVRFTEFFRTRYISILRMAKKCRQGCGKELTGYLKMLIEVEEDKSVNSWDAVLYRSIISDNNLMQFLESGSLPENL